ncbi:MULTISPECIES: aromatic acid/H+ symport family MFS transporter [unclassified Amycolatopsis]|uniref:MFS transporter n=1 Tax=unclassified Amycolatopsis TaxID=2618356 RepID=UPI001F114004|nr:MULTISPECIES: aromatic acid/H+ symport family MFS transporter [unclassified Amycolatopsis]
MKMPWRAIAIGLAVMTLEGYDLVAFGATTPLLLRHQPWQLSLPELGTLGSLTPVGMLFGALLVGPLTDRHGRRRTTLLSIAIVSLGMFACAFAPNPELFGASRLLVGLGVGAVYPAMGPLIFELAPPKRKNLSSAIVQCGVTIGGSLAAVVAAAFLSGDNFRPEYLVGGAVGLLLVPMTYRWLPESPVYRREPTGARGLRVVLRPPYTGTTVLFCAMVICSFLLIFGINTWLPQLMQTARYPLDSSLMFLTLVNVGATVGGLAIAALADRAGSRIPIIACFVVAAGAMAALSVRSPLPVLSVIVLIGGAGAFGVQGLINVYVARTYPAHARASAIGVALGIGRIGAIAGPVLGGWVLAAGFAPQWNFLLFAVPAILGAILTVVLGSLRRTAETPASRPVEEPA